jgi:hypothetical protein
VGRFGGCVNEDLELSLVGRLDLETSGNTIALVIDHSLHGKLSYFISKFLSFSSSPQSQVQ